MLTWLSKWFGLPSKGMVSVVCGHCPITPDPKYPFVGYDSSAPPDRYIIDGMGGVALPRSFEKGGASEENPYGVIAPGSTVTRTVYGHCRYAPVDALQVLLARRRYERSVRRRAVSAFHKWLYSVRIKLFAVKESAVHE